MPCVLLHLATKRYRAEKNLDSKSPNLSPSKQLSSEVKAMKPFNTARYIDKRDEVIIALIVAFIPMVSLGAMIHI